MLFLPLIVTCFIQTTFKKGLTKTTENLLEKGLTKTTEKRFDQTTFRRVSEESKTSLKGCAKLRKRLRKTTENKVVPI